MQNRLMPPPGGQRRHLKIESCTSALLDRAPSWAWECPRCPAHPYYGTPTWYFTLRGSGAQGGNVLDRCVFQRLEWGTNCIPPIGTRCVPRHLTSVLEGPRPFRVRMAVVLPTSKRLGGVDGGQGARGRTTARECCNNGPRRLPHSGILLRTRPRLGPLSPGPAPAHRSGSAPAACGRRRVTNAQTGCDRSLCMRAGRRRAWRDGSQPRTGWAGGQGR